MERRSLCYVYYSKETADLFSIGFMPYAKKGKTWKSFVFEIHYFVNYRSIKGKAKDLHDDALVFLGNRKGEEETKQGEESLGGLLNPKFRYSEDEDNSDSFLGFLFDFEAARGRYAVKAQKALEWFALKSSEMPSYEEIKKMDIPKKFDIDYPEKEEEFYYQEYSRHSLEELAKWVGFELRDEETPKTPRRGTRSSSKAPSTTSRNRSRGREEETKETNRTRSRSRAKEEETPRTERRRAPPPEKEITTEDIQKAFELIFEAAIKGKINIEEDTVDDPTVLFSYEYFDNKGEFFRYGEDKPVAVRYLGYGGYSRVVNAEANAELEEHTKAEYDTQVLSLSLKLLMRRENPKSI